MTGQELKWTDFVFGKLLGVGTELTTTPGPVVEAETGRSSPRNRSLCRCEHCRKRGIENQTTAEYRQAHDISVPVNALQDT